MKNTKKWLLIFISLIISFATLTGLVYAANGSTNVDLSASASEVTVGETVTVSLSNKAMKVEGFSCGFYFDKDLLECVSIVGGNAQAPDYFYLSSQTIFGFTPVFATGVSSVDNANAMGTVGFIYAGTSDAEYSASTLLIATFKCKTAGQAKVSLYEQTNGTDAFSSENIETINITIKSNTPACDHSEKEYIDNGDAGHTEKCKSCGETKTTPYHNWSQYTGLCVCGNSINYTITFDANGGKFADDSEVAYFNGIRPEEIEYPVDPTREGYSFIGWDPNPVTLNKSETLKAQWTVNSYKVNYYVDSVLVHTDEVSYGAVIPAYTYTVTDSTSEFAGWTNDPAGQTMGAADIDVYGTTTVKTFTVTFTINGEPYSTKSFAYGAAVIAPEYTAPVGNTFSGWDVPATMPAENITLDATLTANTYTVTFDANGGKFADSTTTYTVSGKYGTAITYPGTPTRVGYVFNGWSSTPSAFENTVTIKAQWNECDHESFGYTNSNDGQNHVATCKQCGFDKKEGHKFNENNTCVCGEVKKYTGWITEDGKITYVVDDVKAYYTKWMGIEGSWYYFDATGYVTTGIARVPYPTVAINGITYAPDQEAIAYCQQKGKTFIDAEKAWFIFGEDGKFQYTVNGMVNGNQNWAVNGMLAWHPGAVEYNGDVYYFIGDETNGGNILANGEYYIIKANGIAGLELGDVYSFTNGKFSGYNGMVNGKYYENSQLMLGAGLLKLDGGYIYVRSNGAVATGKYWITTTNGLLNAGMYDFGESGYIQTEDPTLNGLVDGVYYKNGMPYYAGLIEIDGETYYIRSNGKVATGIYYVTRVDNYTGTLAIKTGDKLEFDSNGKLIF